MENLSEGRTIYSFYEDIFAVLTFRQIQIFHPVKKQTKNPQTFVFFP